MPDEIGVSAQSINAGLVELGLVGMALQIGSYDVGSIGRGPCGSVDKVGVRLGTEGVEGFAQLRRGLGVGFDWGGRDILPPK